GVDGGGKQAEGVWERGCGGRGVGGGVRENQRQVGVGLIGKRPFPLQPPVGTPHLAVIGGEDDDRVPPQIHFVQDIHDLLERAVFVSDRVQIGVVEDAPHIFSVRGGASGPAVPALFVFQKSGRHAGSGE